MSITEDVAVRELKEKLAEEEQVYAELLAELDRLGRLDRPFEIAPDLESQMSRLNASWEVRPPEVATSSKGLKRVLRSLLRRLFEPELAPMRDALTRQQAFNSFAVQFLNNYVDAQNRHSQRLSSFSSMLVRYAQRVDRLIDAKDRLYASLGNSRADLLIESMDKRVETIAIGLKRAQARLDSIVSSVDLARSELASIRHASKPAAKTTRSHPPAPQPFTEPDYLAFEERFRGDSAEIRERLAGYVPHFRDRGPVVDLGCGRGEFLELLRDADIEARGVDGNPEMVAACRDRGLDVEEGDLVTYLSRLDKGSVGGIFAAQVVEHLPPTTLRNALAASHRALVDDGRVVLETVNTKSVLALIESFFRDLTHQKPLHPETLDFLLRASGFRDVSIEYHSPVSERAKLLSVLPKDESARTLNANFSKLNDFLFADLDYAAIAIK